MEAEGSAPAGPSGSGGVRGAGEAGRGVAGGSAPIASISTPAKDDVKAFKLEKSSGVSRKEMTATAGEGGGFAYSMKGFKGRGSKKGKAKEGSGGEQYLGGKRGNKGGKRCGGKCWYCHVEGHPWFKCRRLPDGWRPGQPSIEGSKGIHGAMGEGMGSVESDAGAGGHGGMFYHVGEACFEDMVVPASKVALHRSSHWVMDTGAFMTMTNREDLLDEVRPSKATTVVSATGQVPTTLRTLLAGATIKGWVVKQMDVTTAFLNGILEEEIFMAQPEGFDDGSGRVWKLKKALYGLKHAPTKWYLKLCEVLEEIGFTPSSADHSLFMLGEGEQRSFMVGYVDDILIFSPSSDLVKEVMLKLRDTFKCKFLGDMSFYLGLHIERDVEKRCMRVHQRKYLEALAANFGQTEGHVDTPFPSGFKCVKGPEEESIVEKERRCSNSLVGSLMYAAVNTRPDVAFATGQLARGVDGVEPGRLFLTAFSDASYASEPEDMTSIDVLREFKNWLVLVERQTKKSMLSLRSDRGGEFLGKDFTNFVDGKGIVHDLTCPYTPQQNGMAEREMRTVVESVRTMLLHMGLLTGKKPNLTLAWVWGCMVQFMIPEQKLGGKLAPKAHWGLHLGVSLKSKGWEVLDLTDNKVVTLVEVIFYETLSLEVWKAKYGPASGRTQAHPPTDTSTATVPLLTEVDEPLDEDNMEVLPPPSVLAPPSPVANQCASTPVSATSNEGSL
ncbi:unnamed protein product [Closterium sp. NIES-53]